jgi:hypothetical protein
MTLSEKKKLAERMGWVRCSPYVYRKENGEFIDIEGWFPDTNPKDFRKVLDSLLYLRIMFIPQLMDVVLEVLGLKEQ